MKILIIGGSGILSGAVVNNCIDRGYSVTMINRGRRLDQLNPSASLIKCDVRDSSQLEKLSKELQNYNFDAVIDFLVLTVPQLKISLQYFSHLAKQYVFISSAQVYNTSIKGLLTEESPKPQPKWSYSVNKLECENYLEDFCNKNHVTYTIIRPAVNYDGTRIPYGIFPPMGYHWTLVERIKNGKPIITWNKGSNKLNLTRVEDFAEATVGLLGNPLAYNEDFNVAGEKVYSWLDVITALGELIGKEPVTFDLPVDFYVKELPGYQKEELAGGRSCDMVCSIEKLRKVLPNFREKYDLKEGIKMTLDYYKNNNYLNGIDYTFDGDCDRIIKTYCRINNVCIPKECRFINYFNDNLINNFKLYYYPFVRKSKIIQTLYGLFKRFF